MKIHLLFLAVLLACATASHAQKISATQVPAAAKAAFNAQYPMVKTIAWTKDAQKVSYAYEYETHNDFKAREAFLTQEIYEAHFKLNGQKTSVVITPSGIVQETETSLSTNKLPANILATLARDFEAYQLQEAATITKADGSIVYEAELAQAGKKQDVLFTADGQQAPQ